jgi:hypothetical protein
MGAKTKITQAPTMTPEQLALLNSMMRGATNQMQGVQLGQTWGGPGTTSRQGIGGTQWNPSAPAQGGGSNPFTQFLGPGGMPQAPIAGAPAVPGGQQGGSGAMVNPFGLAAYSNRDNLVNPIVNPFRRNIGG